MRLTTLKRLQYLAASVAIAAIVGFTGCVTSPLDGDEYASMDSTITVTGFTQKPNQHVHVMVDPAFPSYPSGIVGEATTGTTPIYAHGNTWYAFSVKIKLKEQYWGWASDGRRRAVLRFRKYESTDWEDLDFGTPLYTFSSWAFEPEKNLIDFWADHGHGTSVEIFAPDN